MVIRRMATTKIHPPRDPNTLSNYNNFLTTHTTANLRIDFDNKRLTGNVLLDLKSITDAETREIVLDTSHLDVKGVKVDGDSSKWELLSNFDPYGRALKIKLESGVADGKSVQVDVGFCWRKSSSSNVEADEKMLYIDLSINHRKMHCVTMAYASSNFEQEASVYVSAMPMSCSNDY